MTFSTKALFANWENHDASAPTLKTSWAEQCDEPGNKTWYADIANGDETQASASGVVNSDAGGQPPAYERGRSNSRTPHWQNRVDERKGSNSNVFDQRPTYERGRSNSRTPREQSGNNTESNFRAKGQGSCTREKSLARGSERGTVPAANPARMPPPPAGQPKGPAAPPSVAKPYQRGPSLSGSGCQSKENGYTAYVCTNPCLDGKNFCSKHLKFGDNVCKAIRFSGPEGFAKSAILQNGFVLKADHDELLQISKRLFDENQKMQAELKELRAAKSKPPVPDMTSTILAEFDRLKVRMDEQEKSAKEAEKRREEAEKERESKEADRSKDVMDAVAVVNRNVEGVQKKVMDVESKQVEIGVAMIESVVKSREEVLKQVKKIPPPPPAQITMNIFGTEEASLMWEKVKSVINREEFERMWKAEKGLK